ncbi:MAG: hypothetical protein JWL65_772 [Gammaproteobacteria bacterium]|nr:hypothetical protein [Gammaproteobacteria bacterium]
MRSEVETARRRTRAGAGAALALMTLLTAITTTAAEAPQPTREQVAAAVEKLKADPNLGIDNKTRKLVRNSKAEPNTPPPSPGWLNWLADAFGWFASTARALLWVSGVLLVGILALYIKRFVESRGERSVPLRFSMPTHVRDLDIRPESLPDDVGGAALELWERGEHRAALALLYRGLLSRLAHVHAVPIRDSSTEGDCLALAATHLPAARVAYVERLIRVWQRAVYGNIDPTSEEFNSLSTGFSA